MDPTARNDDRQSKDKTESSLPGENVNPIQPGQFVVAQEEPQNTPASQPAPVSGPPPSTQAIKFPPPVNPSATSPLQAKNAPQNVSPPHVSDSQLQVPPSVNVSPAASGQKVQSSQPAETGVNQPDPTPFISPQQSQDPSQMGGPNEASKMEKARIVLLVGAALVLILIIAALVWFFILNKKDQEPNRIESQEQVEEPPQLPKRTTGGFSELPPATPEATESASPSPESQPTTSPAQ